MAETTVPRIEGWFEKQAEKEAKKDVLKRSDRLGQVIGLVGIFIAIIFFGYHLAKPTGFFTSAFGTFDAVIFFGINIIGIIPQVVRLVKGRKNPARPFDILNSAFILVALIYFVSKFPFDFSYFAAPLPVPIEFLISWVSNGIASALMILGIVGLLFALPYQMLLYLAIRDLPQEVKGQPTGEAQPLAPEAISEEPK